MLKGSIVVSVYNSLSSLRTRLKLSYLKQYFLSNVIIKSSDKPVIWFFLAADYGNLGDIAITKAQTEFLKQRFPQFEVREIPASQTLQYISAVARIVSPSDIIILVGGGNMSDLYEDIEFFRQLVIKKFPQNRIISFPQSIFLTDTKRGARELKRMKRIYGKHKSLTLFARDSISYSRMLQYFPHNTVKLCPDIVMSLELRKKNNERKNRIVFCLRNDLERGCINIAEIETLKNYAESHFDEQIFIDTQVPDELVKHGGGDESLGKLLELFSNSKLVVTDRLHGMIFAFITGTPALVFDNSTKKISATYKWVKDCGFIHLVDENTDFSILKFEDNYNHNKATLDSIFEQLL